MIMFIILVLEFFAISDISDGSDRKLDFIHYNVICFRLFYRYQSFTLKEILKYHLKFIALYRHIFIMH